MTPETITVAAGQTIAFRTVNVPADNIGENDEIFRAILRSPSPNAILGDDMATVTITDTTNVRVEFNPTTYSENENGGSFFFNIVKLDQSDRAVSVVFNTAAVSALGMVSIRLS